MSDTGAALAAEVRAARVAGAAGVAARNEPRWMLTLAAGVCAICAAWLVLAAWQRSNAARALETQREMTKDLLGAVAALRGAADDEASALGGDALKPNPLLASEIERLAKEAGVYGATVVDAVDQRQAPAGVRRMRYTMANMPPQHLEDVLKWATRTTEELPGVALATLELQPATATHDGKPRWTGTVSFSRWERRP